MKPDVESTGRSRGRPRKYGEERPTLTIRLRAAPRQMIEVEAAKNGRSMSEEVEYRVEKSLEDQERAGKSGHATMQLLRVFSDVINRAEFESGGSWSNDLYSRAAVRHALLGAIAQSLSIPDELRHDADALLDGAVAKAAVDLARSVQDLHDWERRLADESSRTDAETEKLISERMRHAGESRAEAITFLRKQMTS